MATIGNLIAYIGIDNKRLRTGLTKAQGMFRNAGKRIIGSLNKIRRMIFSLGTAVIAFAGAYGLMKLIKSFIKAGDVAESYGVRLKVLLRSTSEGNRLFRDMTKFASKVPFEYEQIMNAATQLAGVMRGGVDEIKKWMPLIGDLAATTGLDIAKTTEQVIRMYAAGAASADLFRERGVLAMLGFQSGVQYTAEETRKILWEAWVKIDSQFRKATGELAKTWSGKVSMMRDAWFLFRNAVWESGLGEAMKSMLEGVIKKIEEFKKRGDFEKWAKDTAIVMVDSIAWIIEAIGKLPEAFFKVKEAIHKVTAGVLSILGAVTRVRFALEDFFALPVPKSWLFPPVVIEAKKLERQLLKLDETLLGLTGNAKEYEKVMAKRLGVSKALDEQIKKANALGFHVNTLLTDIENLMVIQFESAEASKASAREYKKITDAVRAFADELRKIPRAVKVKIALDDKPAPSFEIPNAVVKMMESIRTMYEKVMTTDLEKLDKWYKERNDLIILHEHMTTDQIEAILEVRSKLDAIYGKKRLAITQKELDERIKLFERVKGFSEGYHLFRMQQLKDMAIKMEEAGVEEVDINRWMNEEVKELWRERYEAQLEYATSFGEALKAKFSLMVMDTKNQFQEMADTVGELFEETKEIVGDVFFDAMMGKLETFRDYWMSAWSTMARVLSNYMTETLASGFLNWLQDAGILAGQKNQQDLQAIVNTNILTGALAVQTSTVGLLTTSYWALAAAKAAAGLAGGGGVAGVGMSASTVSTGTVIAHKGGVVMHAGGGVFDNFPRYHRGGMAGLKSDERPIIAQVGEGIVSKKPGMQVLEQINKGKLDTQESQPPIIVDMKVYANDADSFRGQLRKSKDALAEVLMEVTGRNHPIRRGRV